MNNSVNEKNVAFKENVLAGIVGAFLFSLVGAAVYFLLHLIGYIASISGLIGAVCAVKGYAVFAKKESKKGIIIAAVISLLVMAIAWYLCLAYDVYDAYKLWYEAGEVDFTITFADAVQAAHVFLEEPEIASEYFKDLVIGLLFCVLGAGSYIVNKVKNAGKKNTEEPETQGAAPSQESAESETEEVPVKDQAVE